MTFGQRLQELRQAAGLSQPALAKASGLPVGSIRNYEQNLRWPLWPVLFKLADAMGLTVDKAFRPCADAEPPASARKRAEKAKRRGKK